MIKEFQGEYRWLSNFWPVKVTYGDVEYPSVEHAYQAAKSLDPNVRASLMAVAGDHPGGAKRFGKTVALRSDWETVKVSIMRDLVTQKFTNDLELQEKLLATGDLYLEETNTWGDQFWGVCGGKGKNVLGNILMEIRREISASVVV